MTGRLPPLSADVRRRLEVLASSYQRLAGRPIEASGSDVAQTLWDCPAAIVAHGTQNDPLFFFGNRVALDLFEMDFEAFTRLPSRLSAEPLLRTERERVLARGAPARRRLVPNEVQRRLPSPQSRRWHRASAPPAA